MSEALVVDITDWDVLAPVGLGVKLEGVLNGLFSLLFPSTVVEVNIFEVLSSTFRDD